MSPPPSRLCDFAILLGMGSYALPWWGKCVVFFYCFDLGRLAMACPLLELAKDLPGGSSFERKPSQSNPAHPASSAD